MALLWPESASERASNSFRQVLHWVRRDLGEEVFLSGPAGGLLLDPGLVRSDVEQFRNAIVNGMPELAVHLYQGPFLDGFHLPGAPEFGQWLEAERDRLRRQHIAALADLSVAAAEAGRLEDAVGWRRRQAAADPYSSGAALALLEALAAAGDRPGAFEYAAIHEQLVRQHLEVEPDPAIAAFVARLRESSRGASVAEAPESRVAVADRHVAAVPLNRADTETPPSARAEPVPNTATGAPTRTRRKPAAHLLRSRRVLVTLCAGLVLLGLWAVPFVMERLRQGAGAAGPVIVASGMRQAAGRDPNTTLVQCDGPACPPGPLPQQAFIVATHPLYTSPSAGSTYIAPVPDGTERETPGYACCTTAVFEQKFKIPDGTARARITVSVLGDNQVGVSINGIEFGQQPYLSSPGNHSGQPMIFTRAFVPDRDAGDRLRITLRDQGGALGVYFHAVVTYDSPTPPPR